MNGAAKHPLNDPDTTASGFFGVDDTNPQGRRTVLQEDLLERLTKMIQSCEGCDGVRVVRVFPDAPDKEGCNWSSTLVLEPNGVEAPVYALGYATIIATARESWNLAE